MIKDGKIPGVVHEPPTGIRLVAPVERQQTQVLSPPPLTSPRQQQQQLEQAKETQPSVLDTEWSSSSPGPAAGLPQISPPNIATGGGWEEGLKVDPPVKESDGAKSRVESPESDIGGAGGSVKSYSEKTGGGNEGRNSAEREKEVVDWRNLQRNVNFLLKEEGPLSARVFNECYTKRFRKVRRESLRALPYCQLRFGNIVKALVCACLGLETTFLTKSVKQRHYIADHVHVRDHRAMEKAINVFIPHVTNDQTNYHRALVLVDPS